MDEKSVQLSCVHFFGKYNMNLIEQGLGVICDFFIMWKHCERGTLKVHVETDTEEKKLQRELQGEAVRMEFVHPCV